MRTEREPHNHILQSDEPRVDCQACSLIRPEVMVADPLVFRALRFSPVSVFGSPRNPTPKLVDLPVWSE